MGSIPTVSFGPHGDGPIHSSLHDSQGPVGAQQSLTIHAMATV